MPFIDFNSGSIKLDISNFDYTIVGGGAAGILLAIRLTRRGNKVLLIESGNFEEDPERQKLNDVIQTGKFLQNATIGRKRAIGGTTIAWGGQSLPFGSLDFENKPWVTNSGWPITLDTLTPFYPLANEFMKIDTLDYRADIFKLTRVNPLAFDEEILDYHFSKWAPEPNFRKLYHNELSESVTVLYNAVLTEIETTDLGEAKYISISNYSYEIHRCQVKTLIITCGTIETVRILLNNKLGNSSGLLGKGFMDHPCIEVGTIETDKPFRLQQQFNTHLVGRRKYSLRLSMAEKAQVSEGLLNASASIMFTYQEDKFDPYFEIKQFLKTKKITSLFLMLKTFPALFYGFWAIVMKKLIYKHKAIPRLVLMLEQEPISDSTIKLSNQWDQFNQYKAEINWIVTDKTWKSVQYMEKICRNEIDRLGLGILKTKDIINLPASEGIPFLSDVNHHMGGARMSKSPDEGVVNKNLQMWDNPNIYLCSCAVFPTGSHSNPTLTLLALAERLSQHLSPQL